MPKIVASVASSPAGADLFALNSPASRASRSEDRLTGFDQALSGAAAARRRSAPKDAASPPENERPAPAAEVAPKPRTRTTKSKQPSSENAEAERAEGRVRTGAPKEQPS